MKHWILQNLIAFDQQINAILGGWADEALSARAYRKGFDSKAWNAFRVFINLLFFWQEDHCYRAYLAEVDRKQLAREYRR